MLRFKELPEPVPVTTDNSAFVVGWVDDCCFVVRELTLPEDPTTAEQTIDRIIDYKKGLNTATAAGLDGEEPQSFSPGQNPGQSPQDDDADYISLWEWAKKKDMSLADFDQLQTNLLTYLPFSEEGSEGLGHKDMFTYIG